jgi:DNA-binding MarR family transcriptional regulator
MEPTDAATAFNDLFAELHGRLYTRRSPRAPGITREGLALLHHLWRAGPLTVGELARHLDRSQAATSEMVERLIGRGLLDRMADERDRRRHFIWLTDEGQTVLRRESRPLDAARLATALAGLSADERAALVGLMKRLTEQCVGPAPQRRVDPTAGDAGKESRDEPNDL